MADYSGVGSYPKGMPEGRKPKTKGPQYGPANPMACKRHIDDKGGCRLTTERSELMAKPKHGEPVVAEVNEDGTIDVTSELDVLHLRVALARWVHPKDMKRALARLTKVNGFRPIRPASQVCNGKSILEMLYEELDAIVERLMAGAASEEDKGRAQGVAYAIAVIENPYMPNIERVREAAMDRWEAEQ